MKIFIKYEAPNWNKYINLERASYHAANVVKQKEKKVIKDNVKEKYEGNYPVEIKFKPHFKDYRQDLDNFRYKGLLDGLVANEVIKNDNLKHIQKIILEPVFDKEKGVEIEIKEME